MNKIGNRTGVISLNIFSTLLDDLVVEVDTNQVVYKKKHVFKDCMIKSRAELVKWLYQVIHTGNENSISVESFNPATDLTAIISRQVADPGIKIPLEFLKIEKKDIVEFNGVRIKISNEELHSGFLKLSSHRPNLTPGFYMFVDTIYGHNNNTGIIRYYIAARDHNYAISCWSKGIKKLRSETIPFSAKVLSNASSYPRNDAVVFYCDKKYSESVSTILSEIVVKEVEESPMPGSILCKKIINNLSMSEQPFLMDNKEQSFGEHRCNCIADAIRDVFATGLSLEPLLLNRMDQYGIDVKDFAKNKMVSNYEK